MTGPTLTAYTTGNPWVEVYFNPADVHVDCEMLTIYRFSENRTWKVRGGVDVAPGVAAQDFEVPFGVESVYRAEQFDVNGLSLGFTDTSAITLDVEGTWVHNPLEPSDALEVEIDDVSGDRLTRPTPGELVYIEGATVARRIGERRRGLEGVRVSLSVFGTANADTLQGMLGSYESSRVAVLCLRTSESVRWPRTFFFGTDELDERPVDVQVGGDWVQFVADVDEVEPPFPGLVRPLLTYDDLDAAFPDYDDQDTEFGTYTAKDRAYEYAGFADAGA